MKRCRKCGETKDESKFNKDIKSKDNLRGSCRDCEREYQKIYHQKNKERRKEYYVKNKKRIQEYYKSYHKNNYEAIKEHRKEYNRINKKHAKEYRIKAKEKIINNRLLRSYGLTLAERQEMEKRQNGRCASCGMIEKLEVDHNHTTGKVRELLCHKCNVSYGKLKEDVGIIQGLLRYAMKWNNL